MIKLREDRQYGDYHHVDADCDYDGYFITLNELREVFEAGQSSIVQVERQSFNDFIKQKEQGE